MHWKMWMWSCMLQQAEKTSRVWHQKKNALGLTCVHLVILLPWHVPATQRTMSGTGVAADCPLLHPAPLPAWEMIPSLSHGGVFCWNSSGIPYSIIYIGTRKEKRLGHDSLQQPSKLNLSIQSWEPRERRQGMCIPSAMGKLDTSKQCPKKLKHLFPPS